jgi:hypothetical protein
MLKALQQRVTVGAGGKIELVAPECPEGSDVQVIVLLSPQPQSLEPEPPPDVAREDPGSPVPEAIARIQGVVRRYVPEDHSLVDELIADRRAEADCE